MFFFCKNFNFLRISIFDQAIFNSARSANEIQLDRLPEFLHWGRIDDRTGIDQRAEVGLLTRNVKVTSELGTECQYAFTRDATDRMIKAEL